MTHNCLLDTAAGPAGAGRPPVNERHGWSSGRYRYWQAEEQTFAGRRCLA